MKNLNQTINEATLISLGHISTINEAWGATKHYKAELEKIFTDYEKKKAPKKVEEEDLDQVIILKKYLQNIQCKY